MKELKKKKTTYLKTNLGIMRTFLKYQGISLTCDSYEIH